MTKDEALKLALDFLMTRRMGAESVIDALQAVLAQPEQEIDWKDMYEKEKRRSDMWLVKYEAVAGLAPKAYPQSQREQEPGRNHWENGDVFERIAAKKTAAAQRKPLTDVQIMDAFCVTPGIHQFVQAFKAGARYAEAAHDIKENT